MMNDHEIRELVSELTRVADRYAPTQQLRQRIAAIVVPVCKHYRDREAMLRQYIDAAHGTGPIVHCYDGTCPDPTQPDSRDPECPACQLLLELEAGPR